MQIPTIVTLAIDYFIIYCTVFWLIVLLQRKNEVKKTKLVRHYPSVEILIPAYNEEKNIEKCVESALALDYPKGRLKITVINDGSTDRTREICEGYVKKGLINLINKSNSGKANSLNTAIKNSKAELIGCMDADSYYLPNHLKAVIDYFEDPKVGAVAPSMKASESKTIWQKVQNIEYMFSNYLRILMSSLNCLYVTPGPGSVYRKSAILDGFDESNLAEDMEIAFRLHKKGYKIVSSLDAMTYTETPRKFIPLVRQRRRWYVGYFDNLQKHKDMIFNKKYGELGMWLIPSNFIWIPSIIFLTGISLYNSGEWVYRNIRHMFLIDFDILPHLKDFFDFSYLFDPMNLNVLTFFNLFLLVCSLLIIVISIKMSNEKLTDKRLLPDCAWYFATYSFLISGFWLYSVLYKFARWNRGDLKGWQA